MKYILGKNNKDYMSWSSYNLWKRSKKEYRKRYYEGIFMPMTVEIVFGKKIASQLEDKKKKIKNLPTYNTPEKGIKITLGSGLKLLGYIDQFDDIKLAFREVKTGHKNIKGESPWNNVKVHRHEQLTFYSLLIELEYSKVDPVCYLDWLETRFMEEEREFAGHKLTTQSRKLELTGEIETFKRHIFKWEREALLKDIRRSAKEIHEDYEKYNK